MSKAPSMPMYWDAYLADTTHLTTEEHGAYLLLLAAMWRRNGSVPDNDRDNARILGLSAAKWRKTKARLAATISGFHVSDGTITQEKLQKTWQNTQEKIDKNRKNGAKGGRCRSSKSNNLDQAKGSVSDNPNASIPEPEPEPEPDKEDKSSLSKDDDFQNFKDAYPADQFRDTDECQQAWEDALADGVQAKTIIDAARRYAGLSSGFDDHLVMFSDNWLLGKRWEKYSALSVVDQCPEKIAEFWGERVKERIADGRKIFGLTDGSLALCIEHETITPEQAEQARRLQA